MDYPRKILDRSVPWFDRRFAKDIQLTCVTLCCVDNIPFTKQKQTKHKKKTWLPISNAVKIRAL